VDPERRDISLRGVQGTQVGSGNVQVNLFAGAVAPPARSAYLEQVRRIAPPDPPGLVGREDELAELARFCLDPGSPSYAWWQAGPWAGKSALLSTFVLHPPPEVAGRVRIISFFITARLAAQDTREAFTEVLIEQLAEMLGQSLPAALTQATRDAYLLNLLSQAAAASAEAGSRLLLVVDGLDEDRGETTGPFAHSIAGLLPANPPAGMRVIVAGRRNPPVPGDVPEWHPLRNPQIIRPLTRSRHAQGVRRLARQELQRLLKGTSGEQQLLGLVTAARGGLTARDLAELTAVGLWEVESILRDAAGRTFRGRPSRYDVETRPEVYLLGHEELQAAATDYLGDRLTAYREDLHAWAERYRARGWPPETPEYLLSGYFRLLDDLGDLPGMTRLACDTARHDLMLRLTGGDAASLAEISTAQRRLLAQERPDLASLAILGLHEDRLIRRNSHLSPLLPGVLARLGAARRAEQLARGLTYPGPRARALAEIAAVITETEPERAHRLIDDAENLSRAEGPQDETLIALAAAARRSGDHDRAERFCGMIDSPGSMAIALGYAAGAVAATDPGRARRLAGQAEQIAGSATDTRERERALQGAALALARAGQTDRAQRLARDITPEWSQGTALRAVAAALARCGRHVEARRVADSIADVRSRSGALADLACALAQVDPASYDRIVHESRQLASQLRPRERADALGELAAALATADPGLSRGLADEAEEYARQAQDPGPEVTLVELASRLAAAEPHRARRLADEAERLARGDTSERPAPVSVPSELAEALAHAGYYDRAEKLNSLIPDSETRAGATGELAAALARAGEYDRAEQLIGTIAGSQGWPAVTVAAALAQAGEYARAERLIATITSYRELSTAKRHLSMALSRAGELDRAEHVARTIAKPWHRNVALEEVAVSLARSGQPDRAEETARSIGTRQFMMSALLEISEVLAKSGDTRAKRLADEVEAHARTAGTTMQADTMWRLSVTLADTDPGHARRLADEAEQIAAATGGTEPRTSALQRLRLAGAATSSGDYDHAERIAGTISEPRPKAEALADLAAALAAKSPGRATALVDQAGELAATLPDAGIKAALMLHIAKTLAEPTHLPAALHQRACRFLALSLTANSTWRESLAVLAKLQPPALLAVSQALLAETN
jgi:hypothetical protein